MLESADGTIPPPPGDDAEVEVVGAAAVVALPEQVEDFGVTVIVYEPLAVDECLSTEDELPHSLLVINWSGELVAKTFLSEEEICNSEPERSTNEKLSESTVIDSTTALEPVTERDTPPAVITVSVVSVTSSKAAKPTVGAPIRSRASHTTKMVRINDSDK